MSSCHILSHSGVLLRSCSSSQSPFSLNLKKFLFWGPALLCQVWLKLVDVYNVIHQQRTDGGMDEHRHFILEAFFSQKARLKSSLWNRDQNLGGLPPYFTILITQPLSWFCSVNTEFLHAEQHSLYRREWECHCQSLSCQCLLNLVELIGIISETTEKRVLRVLWRTGSIKSLLKQVALLHIPVLCDLLGDTNDSTTTLKQLLVSHTFSLSFSGPRAGT